MRVLIVNKFLYPNGGSETYIFKLGQELERQGHRVEYFGMEHEGRIVGNRADSYTQPMDFHGSGAAALTYPFRIIYSREAREKMRPVLEELQPDVVHLNNINFQLTPSVIDEARDFERKHPDLYAYAGRSLKIFCTAHDAQWVCPNHELRVPSTGELCMRCIDGSFDGCIRNRCIHGSKLRSLLGAREAAFYEKRGTYAEVDRVICPSAFLEGVLQHNRHLKGRTIAMHNFMDIPEAQGEQTKTPDRAAGGQGYVLYFGRYAPEKGIATLMKAAGALPEIPFVFAGSGPLRDLIRGGNVTEKGFLTGGALQEVIRGARFVVYPSEWYENCPFSVMEAQGYGVPVLASDIGGTPELICRTPGQETGELFQEGDAEDLTARIRELYGDAARTDRMSANCAAWTAGHFDTLETYVRKLTRLYAM